MRYRKNEKDSQVTEVNITDFKTNTKKRPHALIIKNKKQLFDKGGGFKHRIALQAKVHGKTTYTIKG